MTKRSENITFYGIPPIFTVKKYVLLLLLCFIELTNAANSTKHITIKVAILDQLMSQKFSSIIYKDDYLKGIKLAAFMAKKYNDPNNLDHKNLKI